MREHERSAAQFSRTSGPWSAMKKRKLNYPFVYPMYYEEDPGDVAGPVSQGIPWWRCEHGIQLASGKLEVGSPGQLHIKARNRGDRIATIVRVRVGLATPSTVPHFEWRDEMEVRVRDQRPLDGIPASAYDQHSSLFAGEEKTWELPFAPGPSDAGHRCIVVATEALPDGLASAVPTGTKPNPAQDRHYAQRNVHIEDADNDARGSYGVPEEARKADLPADHGAFFFWAATPDSKAARQHIRVTVQGGDKAGDSTLLDSIGVLEVGATHAPSRSLDIAVKSGLGTPMLLVYPRSQKGLGRVSVTIEQFRDKLAQTAVGGLAVMLLPTGVRRRPEAGPALFRDSLHPNRNPKRG